MSNENGPYVVDISRHNPTGFIVTDPDEKEVLYYLLYAKEAEALKERLNLSYIKGRASRDAEVDALKSENAELKKQLALEEMNRNESAEVVVVLKDRVKVLEDALVYLSDGRNWEAGRGDFFAFLLPGHSEYGYPPSYAKKALGGKP